MGRNLDDRRKTSDRLLLAQVPASGARDDDLRALVEDVVDGGLVVTGNDAVRVAEHLRGGRSRLLVDRARYQGNRRKLAPEPFDLTWIRDQRRLGLRWILPDAGYVDAGDHNGLVGVLRRTADLGDDAVALLALNLAWLGDRLVPELLDAIRTVGVPVALVLENRADPLDVQYAMRGLLKVLALPVPVMLLRSDVSAVGALCFGAVAAAVGVATSLRHLYPRTTRGGGPPGPPTPSALFRPCLAYKRIDRIATAVARDEDSLLWRCACRYCADRQITVLRAAGDVERACALHSLDLLYQLRDDVLDQHHTVVENQTSWVVRCSQAVGECEELATLYPGDGWEPPTSLRNWTTLGGAAISRPADR